MPEGFRKVQSGERLNIPAQFKTFVDTARIVRNQQNNQRRKPLRAIDQPSIVLVKNSAGEDLDRFHVLGIKQALITPTDNEQEFQNRVALDGDDRERATVTPRTYGRAGVSRSGCKYIRRLDIGRRNRTPTPQIFE